MVSLVGEGIPQLRAGNEIILVDGISFENMRFYEYAYKPNQWFVGGELYIDNAKIKEAIKDGGTLSGEAAFEIGIAY